MMVIEIIIHVVCREGGITRAQLLGDRRWQEIVHARQVAMWLVHRYTGLSLVRIGHLLKRDHTTVLHAVRKIERLRAGHDARQAHPEYGRRLLELAERCDAVLQAQLGSHVPQELPTLETYLASMRRRNALRAATWRQEQRWLEKCWRSRMPHIMPPQPRPPRQVPMSGGMPVCVPPGRNLTGVLLGDPPPGRSALDQRRQRQRISWEARIRTALSISRQKQQEQQEEEWSW